MGKLATSPDPLGRYLLAALFIAVFAYFPESQAQEKSGPLILEHADQLISSGGEGEIVNLVGNVHFTHDKADLYSQRATWYRKSGLVQFNDSVKVLDAEKVITAQTMTYYRRDRRVTAVNDVRLVDLKQDVVMTCQKADYLRNTKQLEATGLPKLIFNPKDDTARMEITSRRMEYFADSSYGVAYDSVRIVRRDMVARAGQAEFYKNPERAILTKDPVIVQGENQLSGDKVFLYTNDRKIDRLFVDGNARALYMALPDTSLKEFTSAELTGRELEAFFAEDEITQMVTRYNATSNYNPAVTDTLVRGNNFASGDSITLYFRHGLIKRVLIAGGAQGKYIEAKFKPDGTGYFDTTHYSAREIDYRFEDSEIRLTDNGNLSFQDMNLTAGEIHYNTETRILLAEGLKDGAGDSAAEEIQLPVLKQGTEELFGTRMSYNLDSKRGQVRMARTKYEGGYYSGEALRQASEDVLLVAQGNYTSCDKPENPHFHFHSDRMKMVNKDKVIARPVVLYIGDLPVFALPYYVFPVRKGRHSGLLTFEIGNFERGERFVRNVGYYWAASDYWDLETSLDFYEGSRVRNEDSKVIYNGILRYDSNRHSLNGNVGFNYSRTSGWNRSNFTRRGSSSWRVNFSHFQDITQTTKLSGSGTFVSSKSFVSENDFDPARRLDQREVRAQANLSKSWVSSSLSVLADQTWNLDTDTKTERLPSISFSRNSLPVFGDPTKSRKKVRIRPDEIIEEPQKRFYHSLYFRMNSNAVNFRQRSLAADSTFTRRDYQTITSSASLSHTQKLLGVLNVQPSLTLSHALARLEQNRQTDSLNLPAHKVVTRTTYSLGVGANTSLYGTINPKIGKLLGVRHVMTPSIGYTFTPDIKKDRNYFSYVGLGAGSTRSKAATYSLTNLFQAKYQSGETEKKIDLFSLNFSGSYNFAADSLQLSNLATSLRTSAIPNLDLSFTSSHSFYDLGTARRRELYRLRPVNISVTTSTKWGYHPSGAAKDDTESPEKDVASRAQVFGRGAGRSQEFSGLGIDMTLSHNYSETRGFGRPQKTQWLNLSTQFQPTRNWRIAYDARYNMIDKRLESQGVNIGRDLHCWQATFTWIPGGRVAGYYLRISIKSLPDIKIEESEGGLRGDGYY